ncbi:MAG: DsbC family protein, partial [Methyloprofundus sp.]|nr:DsbC family protein [Methyloprofundus sp.]
MKKFLQPLLVASLLLSPLAHAELTDTSNLKKTLEQRMPSLSIESIKESEIKGLYEVIMGADIYYASEDGRYLIQGRMFDLVDKIDLTEAKVSAARAKLINAVSKDDM